MKTELTMQIEFSDTPAPPKEIVTFKGMLVRCIHNKDTIYLVVDAIGGKLCLLNLNTSQLCGEVTILPSYVWEVMEQVEPLKVRAKNGGQ
jgi:hypothetical protein